VAEAAEVAAGVEAEAAAVAEERQSPQRVAEQCVALLQGLPPAARLQVMAEEKGSLQELEYWAAEARP